jgi:glycosyltransferase involved in cell wall biosynthesis
MTLFFLTGQINYLRSQGYSVQAIASPDEKLERFGIQEGIPVYGVPMSRRVTPLHDLMAVYRMTRLLRQLRPQIVHAHTPKGGLIGMISAWLAGVPIRIYHIHGLPHVTASGWKRQLLIKSEEASCSLAHQVLCVSHSLKELVIREGICTESRVKVLHNGSISGVDAEQRFNPRKFSTDEVVRIRQHYGIPEDAFVVGFLGRVVPDKGIAELVAAFQSLQKSYPQLHLFVAGPLEAHTPLPESLLETLKQQQRIHLLDEYIDDVPAALAVMNVLVLPSHREGFGVAIIEGSAMELPVIATNIPGCTNAVVEGVTGTLVPVRDPFPLANAIERYMTNPDLCLQHGKAGRQWVIRNFRPIDIWTALCQQYELLVTARKEWSR